MPHCFTGPLPRHLYVYVDSAFTHQQPHGFVPAVWFALSSWPSRAWGCTVLLECGAIYRNLPPHALAFTPEPAAWDIHHAQLWDCYGWDWSANLYPYLEGTDVVCRIEDNDYSGQYLFSVAPVGDAYSASPDQAKEFTFAQLDNGRLTIQPTDRILVREASFTRNVAWPTGVKRQEEIYHAE